MAKNYDSEYQIQQDILTKVGGDGTKCYDSLYSILLEILDKIEGGGGGATYTAGQNIYIDASNAISADGYVFDETKGSFTEKYFDDEALIIKTNTATGYGSHAEGWNTSATGDYGSHVEGAVFSEGTFGATGDYGSHAEGYETLASGVGGSHAEGAFTVASGDYGAHAEGQRSIASGISSHAEGARVSGHQNGTVASGFGSHAEGGSTLASGEWTHTEGQLTETKNGCEHAQGNCNVSHKNSDTYGDAGNTIDSIGIGRPLNNVPQRKNATEVMQNGDYYLYGVGGYQGIDTKVQNASILTLQDVVNGKADAYEVATTADILALFAEPVPPTQPNDEIWYTTSNNEVITIDPEYVGDYFDKPMLSNTYSDGKGIIKFDGDLTAVLYGGFQSITEDYRNITSIQLPESVTELGFGTFEYCSNLVSVKLPSNYTGGIPEQAFNECSSLESIEIPEGTTSIGPSAFSSCSSLESIICKPTTPPYSEGYMFEDTNDCPIYVPAESVNAYKTTEGWTEYANRIEAIQ